MTDVVFDLLRTKGDADYIGEPITQIEHMLEAGQIAFEKGYPDFVVVACLFHDIGHLLPSEKMGALGVKYHEKVGADYLRRLGFNENVCDLVQNHVNAKRYLIAIRKNYSLSEASAQTLAYQGGPMPKEELQRFEQQPQFEWYLKMRQIDEASKGDRYATMKLEDFQHLCDRCRQ